MIAHYATAIARKFLSQRTRKIAETDMTPSSHQVLCDLRLWRKLLAPGLPWSCVFVVVAMLLNLGIAWLAAARFWFPKASNRNDAIATTYPPGLADECRIVASSYRAGAFGNINSELWKTPLDPSLKVRWVSVFYQECGWPFRSFKRSVLRDISSPDISLSPWNIRPIGLSEGLVLDGQGSRSGPIIVPAIPITSNGVLNMCIYALLMIILLILWRIFACCIRLFKQRCIFCSYPLANARCSECGWNLQR
ncbi:MAG: hypothetical protein IT452_08065 [Planctomycetia bacterium]|nr:hypothetical protein [Planctomycetia bacterium]